MNSDTGPVGLPLVRGTRSEALEALRALLALALPDVEPRSLPALSAEFRKVLAEQDQIAPPVRSTSDQLADARSRRRAAAAGAAPPTGDPLDLGLGVR